MSYPGTLIGMATVTRTFLVDDLDGSTEDVQNVRISLDGADFEIDLGAFYMTEGLFQRSTAGILKV